MYSVLKCFHPKACSFYSFRRLLLLLLLPSCISIGAAETVRRADTSTLVDLKIETSRLQPTAGTGLGFIAELKNLSETNIFLRAESVLLVLPPELGGKTNEIT